MPKVQVLIVFNKASESKFIFNWKSLVDHVAIRLAHYEICITKFNVSIHTPINNTSWFDVVQRD